MTYFNDKLLDQFEASLPKSHGKRLDESVVFNSMEGIYENFSKRAVGEKKYDIFLSHRYVDKKRIARLAHILSAKYNLVAYVDWIVDPNLDRTNVNQSTAELIRKRLKNSKSLWVVTSQTISDSKWMPWEAGFMDGKNGKVLICPYIDKSDFKGTEFLSLYPTVYSTKIKGTNQDCVAVMDGGRPYTFENWLNKPRQV